MKTFMSLLSGAPMCVVVLDARGRPVGCNDTFEQSPGPLEKFADMRFNDIASSEAAKHKLGTAMESVSRGETLKVSVTDVRMELKSEGGSPLSGSFTWSVGLVSMAMSNMLDKNSLQMGRGLILMGEPCSEVTVQQRVKDSETADFIQNAPIPLQSTDCKGVIQWVRGQNAGVQRCMAGSQNAASHPPIQQDFRHATLPDACGKLPRALAPHAPPNPDPSYKPPTESMRDCTRLRKPRCCSFGIRLGQGFRESVWVPGIPGHANNSFSFFRGEAALRARALCVGGASSTSETLTQRTALRNVLFYFILFLFAWVISKPQSNYCSMVFMTMWLRCHGQSV